MSQVLFHFPSFKILFPRNKVSRAVCAFNSVQLWKKWNIISSSQLQFCATVWKMKHIISSSQLTAVKCVQLLLKRAQCGTCFFFISSNGHPSHHVWLEPAAAEKGGYMLENVTSFHFMYLNWKKSVFLFTHSYQGCKKRKISKTSLSWLSICICKGNSRFWDFGKFVMKLKTIMKAFHCPFIGRNEKCELKVNKKELKLS